MFCATQINQCLINADAVNLTLVDLLDDRSDPTRKGREVTSLRCLDINASGTYGAERCSWQLCIDKDTDSACRPLNTEHLHGRDKKTHICVELNDAVGVDMCAYNSTFCIDT